MEDNIPKGDFHVLVIGAGKVLQRIESMKLTNDRIRWSIDSTEAQDGIYSLPFSSNIALIIISYNQLNIKCTVYERDAYLGERSRDWSFGIYWAQECFNQCLPQSLKNRLSTAQVDPYHEPTESDFLPLRNAETGEEMMRVPTPFVYRLKRSKFRNLISEGVQIEVCQAQPRILHTD